MSGFVTAHLARYPDSSAAETEQVMAYFPFGSTPQSDTLPVLHGLARNFAVCDHWFSSMPGPTWQNRFFVHSGTCLGHTKMPSTSDPGSMRIYYQETIFDRLSEADIDWKIFHDGIPQSIVLTRLLTRYLTFRGYKDMQGFYDLASGDPDDFPAYAFIEPRYFGPDENDQHPPADIRRGEVLIADVYNAIRSNKNLWESTLLVITSDEHGGFYDHVPPPDTVPPDDHTAEWSFDRLGVRVPMVLVSPWIAKGVVKTVFDHTSLLRYLCEKWSLEPLGARMQAFAGPTRANNFADELTKLTAPRTDTPERLEAAKIPQALRALPAEEPPITGSREALLMFVDQLPDRAPDSSKRVSRAAKSTGKVSPTLSVAAAEAKLAALRTQSEAPTAPQAKRNVLRTKQQARKSRSTTRKAGKGKRKARTAT
jgi:phospholipase C